MKYRDLAVKNYVKFKGNFLPRIPKQWIVEAGKISGAATQIGLALWFKDAVQPPSMGGIITLDNGVCEEYGVGNRETKRITLEKMADAKLIEILEKKKPNDAPSVKIIKTGLIEL